MIDIINISILKWALLALILVLLSGCMQSPEEHFDTNRGDTPNGDELCVEFARILDPSQARPLQVNGVGISKYIVVRIETVMRRASENVYQSIATNAGWQGIVGKMMTIAVIFFGIMMGFGLTQVSAYGTAIFFIKLMLVWILTTQWDVYNTLIVTNFEVLVSDLTGRMANIFSAGVQLPSVSETAAGSGVWEVNVVSANLDLFSYIDSMFNMFLSTHFMKLISALWNSGWTGPVYMFFLIAMLIMYVFAIIKALKVYLVAIIARALLYAVGPIFIVFALFSQTKSLFDGWFEQLINFSLQPIFLFTFLGMFHVMVMGFMAGIMTSTSQQVCYGPVMEFSGGLVDALYHYALGDGSTGSPKEGGVMPAIPLNIWMIISTIVVVHLMSKMCDWTVQLAGRLSGGYISASQVPIHGWDKVQGAVTQGARSAGQSVRSSFSSGTSSTAIRGGGPKSG